ncbi:MAG TPA: hypothetical protein VNN80_20420 [Polyangiaceae bacterium]|nr:hypothetical protein [Polyangiaceae bacterium]
MVWSKGLPWAAVLLAVACGGSGDAQLLFEPWLEGPGARQPAFLAFSTAYDGGGPAPIAAPGFPQRLSDTGAFADLASLEPMSGVVPYDVQVPLWSDGADKRRWLALPEGAPLGYSDTGPLDVPPGTVFIKHFEMALDERFPEQRRRLETRFWVVVNQNAQYGVSYLWNEAQTDAELIVQGRSETLTITGGDGVAREQSYFLPGPGDCQSCHNARAGYVLGARAAQLNRPFVYEPDRPAINQLVAWSFWGMLNVRLDAQLATLVPQLAPLGDDSRDLGDRVRSYWDGNCAMCHAGDGGSVPGWDARYATAFEEQGLDRVPSNASTSASQLIAPGAPESSLIYLRGNTADVPLRMPPVGRNRVDQAYIDALGRWIASLGG